MNCCNDFGACTRAPNCPAGSVVAEKLLAGEKLPDVMTYDGMDWQTAREAMASRQQQAYERAQAQWMRPFKPPFVKHEEVEERLTPAQVLIWCGIVLAVCVVGLSTLLYFFR